MIPRLMVLNVAMRRYQVYRKYLDIFLAIVRENLLIFMFETASSGKPILLNAKNCLCMCVNCRYRIFYNRDYYF